MENDHKQQVKKDIGYDAVLISEFENGYAFKDGSIVNNDLADEDGNSVEKFKSVSFDYEKNGDTVIFSQDKFNSKIDMDGNVIKTVDGADIYYYSYTNKIVPADYKMTDEDKKAEVTCHFCNNKYNFTEEELVNLLNDIK